MKIIETGTVTSPKGFLGVGEHVGIKKEKKDLALIIEDKIPSQEIAIAIKKAAGNLLKEVEIFDVYTGKGIEEGKKSLAYSLTFEAQERTLTDEEINTILQKVMEQLEKKYHAEIRKKEA